VVTSPERLPHPGVAADQDGVAALHHPRRVDVAAVVGVHAAGEPVHPDRDRAVPAHRLAQLLHRLGPQVAGPQAAVLHQPGGGVHGCALHAGGVAGPFRPGPLIDVLDVPVQVEPVAVGQPLHDLRGGGKLLEDGEPDARTLPVLVGDRQVDRPAVGAGLPELWDEPVDAVVVAAGIPLGDAAHSAVATSCMTHLSPSASGLSPIVRSPSCAAHPRRVRLRECSTTTCPRSAVCSARRWPTSVATGPHRGTPGGTASRPPARPRGPRSASPARWPSPGRWSARTSSTTPRDRCRLWPPPICRCCCRPG
jgi:hypothetical protein